MRYECSVVVASRPLQPSRARAATPPSCRYVAEYTCHEAGSFLLDVHAGRTPIAGSPYRLTVLPSAVHAPSCRLLSDGPHAVHAGTTAMLRFESCDVHGNRRTAGGDAFEIGLSVDPAHALTSRHALSALLSAAGETLADLKVAPELTDISDVDVIRTAHGGDVEARTPPPPTVLDEFNGLYAVAFGWSIAGGLRLSIRDGAGRPVPGSPRALDVLADVPSAAHCLARGEWLRGPGVAGSEMRIVLILRDRFGNVTTQGVEGLSCVLRGAVEVPGYVRRFERDGVDGVEAVASPTIGGRYWLHIALRGEPLGASPYALIVQPAAAEASSCDLWGEGVTAATAGTPAYFLIQLRDAHGNATDADADTLSASVETPARVARASLGPPPPPPPPPRPPPSPWRPVDGDSPPRTRGRAGRSADADGYESDDGGGGETCECAIRAAAHTAAENGVPYGARELGLFSGVWRSLRTGRHLMHVTVRGEHVPGSPLPILVKAGPTHVATSALVLDGGHGRLIRPNELLVVRIIARDRWGNVRGEGGDELHVFVQGSARPALQELDDLRTGEYECRLRLPISGSYSVHVRLGKLPLNGSPMKLSVAT
jgi:hypothetical protein